MTAHGGSNTGRDGDDGGHRQLISPALFYIDKVEKSQSTLQDKKAIIMNKNRKKCHFEFVLQRFFDNICNISVNYCLCIPLFLKH